MGTIAGTETWVLPRETKEWIGPITVTASGTVVSSWQAALMPDGQRPTEADWKAPDVVTAQQGVMIGEGSNYPALAPGSYKLWIRFDNATEKPVLDEFLIVIIT